MRIFFSVGEPSGDLHGSNLIRRLRQQDPELQCVGFGGPKMAAAGCELHYDLTSLAVMFAEALKHLRLFFRLIGQANEYFQENAQELDAVVLIDYPGFNWWIARKAKKHGIPVFYYGVPQMWAWAPWRVRKIRRYVDHVLCKLPFEVDWFAKRKCHGQYVGHPYFDQLQHQQYDEAWTQQLFAASAGRRLLTLLPGSRDQEVRNVLPILLSAAAKIQDSSNCRVVIASYNERQRAMADAIVKQTGWVNTVAGEVSQDAGKRIVEVFVGRTPELMKSADVCLACSGSVSMELLHHRKPTVIVYRVKRWVMIAQAFMLRTKFITLVNLIAAKDIRKRTWAPYDPDAPAAQQDPAVMPEYLTMSDPADKVAAQVERWLSSAEAYASKVQELDRIAVKYAKPGATDRAADYILAQLFAARDGLSKTVANRFDSGEAGHLSPSMKHEAA